MALYEVMKTTDLFKKPWRISPRHFLPDVLIIVLSLYASLYLRVGTEGWDTHISRLHAWLPFIVVIRVACLTMFNSYSIMWRYVSTFDAVQIAKAVSLSTLLTLAGTFLVPEHYARLPRTVYIIDALLVMIGLLGIRLLMRLRREQRAQRKTQDGKPTLIYGAGENGRLLANRFRSDVGCDTKVIGFIDDDPKKAKTTIAGIPVMGNRDALSSVIEANEITQLIIALPNLPGELLRDIVKITRPYNIRPRITGAIGNEALDKKTVDIYREIDLADLLSRPRRDMDLASVRDLVRGKRVLVTGAGGSIGSELARQIMSHEPGRLLLMDHSEYNLYEIDKELRLSTHDMQRVVPLLVDIKDEASVRVAMKEYAPEIVFHAAAYKHVHLVEANPYPSILNNVYGTKNILEASKEIDVQTFVMISTDKAVNPAGVMGSTKRVCELLVTAAALETGRRYCSVRFGNVLGSSGSLIPLLKTQIAEGGPVTITHKDMTRFFMLIPEAVSLVLKAATIAQPGDVNVLRMGEPVRILDIAKSLIALMGKTEEEIPIVFTGLRPGEKMFEELYIRGDELKTEHPDILTLPNGDSKLAIGSEELHAMYSQVERMINASIDGKKEALFELNEIVKSKYTAPADEHKDDGRLSFVPGSRHQH